MPPPPPPPPPQGTIAALLQAYCQQGNLAGATQLLEHMGAQDVPISEYVYSHLIQAHARSGDMASAAGMLQVMRENGLPLSSVPYSALLVAHAERGDMEAMEQVRGEGEGGGGRVGGRRRGDLSAVQWGGGLCMFCSVCLCLEPRLVYTYKLSHNQAVLYHQKVLA